MQNVVNEVLEGGFPIPEPERRKMYAFCAILLVIIMVETICLMVGKDTAKKWFAGCLEELTGACEADLGRGLCYAEAIVLENA